VERLTKREPFDHDRVYFNVEWENVNCKIKDIMTGTCASCDKEKKIKSPDCYLGLMIRKLADYEDAEEQGRLVVLPESECFCASKQWYYLKNGAICRIANPDSAMMHVLHNGARVFYGSLEEAAVALNETQGEGE
jgi:hypothetical protein